MKKTAHNLHVLVAAIVASITVFGFFLVIHPTKAVTSAGPASKNSPIATPYKPPRQLPTLVASCPEKPLNFTNMTPGIGVNLGDYKGEEMKGVELGIAMGVKKDVYIYTIMVGEIDSPAAVHDPIIPATSFLS